jgi:hypothetical protein
MNFRIKAISCRQFLDPCHCGTGWLGMSLHGRPRWRDGAFALSTRGNSNRGGHPMSATAKYVELIRNDNLANLLPPLHQVFDNTIDTGGYKDIRVWVHVFVKNYAHAPVTAAAKLSVELLHVFGGQLGGGGQFDYIRTSIPWNNVTSYINGYVTAPIMGDKLRILCTGENLPQGRRRRRQASPASRAAPMSTAMADTPPGTASPCATWSSGISARR